MGYFRSVSKKKRIRNRIILIIILMLILLTIIFYFKERVSNNKNNINEHKEVYLSVSETKKDDKPIIYLYNTHQTEKYTYNKINPYNIDYTVMYASYILSIYLESYGIYSIVEDTSVPKLLNEYNYKYGQSYEISRMLLEKAFKSNMDLKYFFDIHRDSSSYDKTTCIYDNKKYARILFVIGLEHNNYEKNENFALKLNEMLINAIPCISRGIMEKEGENVNGIYNQDFNENTLLFEIGGQYNEIDEVDNTLTVLAGVLNDYIRMNK